MISSTIKDLWSVRDAVGTALASTGLVELVGMAPGSTASQASSSYAATIDLADRCGLYLLILGGRYGYRSAGGKSATQLEYETAIHTDPTKVIVLRQVGVRRDALQKGFVKEVEDYHSGYYVSRFRDEADAADVARAAFSTWLVDRASVGRRLDFFDHFVRIAAQRTPFPGARCEYRLTDDRVELTYRVIDRIYSVHFDKRELYSDFWGSIFRLDQRFEDWRASQFGRAKRSP